MSEVLEEFDNGVMTLTLNRPEARNGLTPELMVGPFTNAVRRAAADPKIRCVVLTGAGKTFCAGGDVNAFPDSDDAAPADTQATQLLHLRKVVEPARILHEMPKPTLAVINGAAAGAGLALALACDFRICLDTAKLTTAFSNIGVSGDCGGSYFLPKVVGPAKARELYFLSELLTGEQAYEIGMVTRAVSQEDLEDVSRAFATRLANLPTVAIGYMKQNLNAADDATITEVLSLEATHMALSLETDDHKNALRAFLNKEPISFKGR